MPSDKSMAEPTPFRRSEEDGVLTVTFTRDAKLNAVSPAMIDGLRAAVDGVALGLAFDADDEDPAPSLVPDGGNVRRHQSNRSTTGLVLRSSLSR